MDLESKFVRCKSEAAARRAVAIIGENRWAYPARLHAAAVCYSNPPSDSAWVLELDLLDGWNWPSEAANRLWVALTPLMAENASLVFRDEAHARWRVRWSSGRAYEESIETITWRVDRELTG